MRTAERIITERSHEMATNRTLYWADPNWIRAIQADAFRAGLMEAAALCKTKCWPECGSEYCKGRAGAAEAIERAAEESGK